jgi:uncharacterized protein
MSSSHHSSSAPDAGAAIFLARSASLISPRVQTIWADAVQHVGSLMLQDGGHDWHHLWRVLSNARAILDGEQHRLDDPALAWDRIAVAVLFHDVVNLPKNHPARHEASRLSADAALAWLSPLHTFSSDLEIIHDAIWSHSFSADRPATSPEAQIVTDADRLDSLGALGLARTFAVGGQLARPLFDPADPLARQRPLDDSIWSVDHIYKKLLTLKDRLYTDTGRAIGQQRHTFLLTFLAQLADELGEAQV